MDDPRGDAGLHRPVATVPAGLACWRGGGCYPPWVPPLAPGEPAPVGLVWCSLERTGVGGGPLGEAARRAASHLGDGGQHCGLIQRPADIEVEERVHVLGGHGRAHLGPCLLVGLRLEPQWPAQHPGRGSPPGRPGPAIAGRSARRRGPGARAWSAPRGVVIPLEAARIAHRTSNLDGSVQDRFG
jgi:hypothetical protein